MLNISELGQLYNPCFFSRHADKHTWSEKQNNPDALANVEFLFQGGSISFISSQLLRKMQDVYRDDATGTLNLRRICDGVLLLDRDDKHYLVILEVKSGFGDVKKKAISQIPASYVKVKSLLNDFTSYNRNDYQEFGLIVSYPYQPKAKTDAAQNPVVMERKRIMVQNKQEMLLSKYNKALRETHSADFLGTDFELESFRNIDSCLFFDKLKVRHCPVADKCVNATIDLDSVIQTLH